MHGASLVIYKMRRSLLVIGLCVLLILVIPF